MTPLAISDILTTALSRPDSLDDDLRGRETFVQQSFFEPQPIKDATALLIRQCTYNLT